MLITIISKVLARNQTVFNKVVLRLVRVTTLILMGHTKVVVGQMRNAAIIMVGLCVLILVGNVIGIGKFVLLTFVARYMNVGDMTMYVSLVFVKSEMHLAIPCALML